MIYLLYSLEAAFLYCPYDVPRRKNVVSVRSIWKYNPMLSYWSAPSRSEGNYSYCNNTGSSSRRKRGLPWLTRVSMDVYQGWLWWGVLTTPHGTFTSHRLIGTDGRRARRSWKFWTYEKILASGRMPRNARLTARQLSGSFPDTMDAYPVGCNNAINLKFEIRWCRRSDPWMCKPVLGQQDEGATYKTTMYASHFSYTSDFPDALYCF